MTNDKLHGAEDAMNFTAFDLRNIAIDFHDWWEQAVGRSDIDLGFDHWWQVYGAQHIKPNTPPQVERAGEDEVAYLIEAQGLRYLGLQEDDGILGWTREHDCALRFSRREDAQMYIDLEGLTGAVAVEHMWCAPPSPLPVERQDGEAAEHKALDEWLEFRKTTKYRAPFNKSSELDWHDGYAAGLCAAAPVERQEPFGYFFELMENGGGNFLGTKQKWISEAVAADTKSEVFALYLAAPAQQQAQEVECEACKAWEKIFNDERSYYKERQEGIAESIDTAHNLIRTALQLPADAERSFEGYAGEIGKILSDLESLCAYQKHEKSLAREEFEFSEIDLRQENESIREQHSKAIEYIKKFRSISSLAIFALEECAKRGWKNKKAIQLADEQLVKLSGLIIETNSLFAAPKQEG